MANSKVAASSEPIRSSSAIRARKRLMNASACVRRSVASASPSVAWRRARRGQRFGQYSSSSTIDAIQRLICALKSSMSVRVGDTPQSRAINVYWLSKKSTARNEHTYSSMVMCVCVCEHVHVNAFYPMTPPIRLCSEQTVLPIHEAVCAHANIRHRSCTEMCCWRLHCDSSERDVVGAFGRRQSSFARAH